MPVTGTASSLERSLTKIFPIKITHLALTREKLLIGVAVSLHAIMMGSLFWGYLDSLSFATHIAPLGVDFFSIYEAGHHAVANESLYEFDIFNLAEAPYSAPYRYVPFFAYGFGAPASFLPPWWGFWAWAALNEVMLISNAYVTWRMSGRTGWGVIAASMWFVFFPFHPEIYKGQFTFLMATALFWTSIGLVQGRQAFAGLPWAFSVLTKSSSVLLAPLFFRLGWFRALVGTTLLLGLNAFYFLWRPGDWHLFYDKNASFLTDANRGFAHPWAGDHGGLALLRETLTALDIRITSTITLALVVFVIGVSLSATVLAKKADPLAIFGIWVAAFFLFFGFVWEFHYVMLLPVLAMLIALRPVTRPWAATAFLLLALPTPYWLLNNVWNVGPIPQGFDLLGVQRSWPTWGVLIYHIQKPGAAFLLWGFLIASQLSTGVSVSWLRSLGNAMVRRLAPAY